MPSYASKFRNVCHQNEWPVVPEQLIPRFLGAKKLQGNEGVLLRLSLYPS
jgi:hypothetical protein